MSSGLPAADAGHVLPALDRTGHHAGFPNPLSGPARSLLRYPRWPGLVDLPPGGGSACGNPPDADIPGSPPVPGPFIRSVEVSHGCQARSLRSPKTVPGLLVGCRPNRCPQAVASTRQHASSTGQAIAYARPADWRLPLRQARDSRHRAPPLPRHWRTRGQREGDASAHLPPSARGEPASAPRSSAPGQRRPGHPHRSCAAAAPSQRQQRKVPAVVPLARPTSAPA